MASPGVRIPELPSYLLYTSTLANDDKIPYYLAAFDKTVWMNVSTFRSFVLTGGGNSIPPVIKGDKIIHDITAAEDGGITVSMPSLAGKNFNLDRDGRPLLYTEYQILSSGGFKLNIPGDILVTGQRFSLELYDFGASSAPGAASVPFLKGTITVPTNYTLSATNDINKLVQVRANTVSVAVTLPLIESVPENTLVIIETLITNQKQIEVKTQSGQYIYMNNTSYLTVEMGLGEVIWLFRTPDGWYVINSFGQVYLDVAKNPIATFKVGLNEVLCKGQTLLRADYPRAWKAIQTFGASVVSEATWQTAEVYNQAGVWSTTAPATGAYTTVPRPYRGAFSSGDGITTFRLPDLMNMSLRGIRTDTGTDSERFLNSPGGFQQQDAKVTIDDMGGDDSLGTGAATGIGYTAGNPSTAKQFRNRLETYGTETRPDNIGVLWVIKT